MNAQWKLTLASMHQMDKDAVSAPTANHGPSYVDALIASQRAWLQFRDTECRVEGYAARGGSMEAMLHANCIAELSRERATQLAHIAKN